MLLAIAKTLSGSSGLFNMFSSLHCDVELSQKINELSNPLKAYLPFMISAFQLYLVSKVGSMHFPETIIWLNISSGQDVSVIPLRLKFG